VGVRRRRVGLGEVEESRQAAAPLGCFKTHLDDRPVGTAVGHALGNRNDPSNLIPADPLDNFVVRPRRRVVEKYAKSEAWTASYKNGRHRRRAVFYSLVSSGVIAYGAAVKTSRTTRPDPPGFAGSGCR
jgi:hypothetical protein